VTTVINLAGTLEFTDKMRRTISGASTERCFGNLGPRPPSLASWTDGDGVREVTALALASLKALKFAPDNGTPTQSGDSEDSVAAVQDARAPTRFALGSWSRCAAEHAADQLKRDAQKFTS
jgi:hypothetical protein